MIKSKHEFFRKGLDQKTPDIAMHLKRPLRDKIEKWTEEEKVKAMKSLFVMRQIADNFFEEIDAALTETKSK